MVARRASAPSSSPSIPRVVIPKTNKDPIWSLKPWPVVVTLKGRDVEIPALPAVDWLVVLMQPTLDLDQFIEELLPEAEDLLYEGLDLEDLYQICLDAIAMVSARPWWVSMRLIGVARDNWEVLGPEMLKVDATRLPLSAWLDILLVTVLHSMDPKETTMFTMKLEQPPPEVLTETEPEELEMSASSFLALGR